MTHEVWGMTQLLIMPLKYFTYTHEFNFARRTCLFARITQEVQIAKFSQYILLLGLNSIFRINNELSLNSTVYSEYYIQKYV